MPYIDKSLLASPAQLPKLAESGWLEKELMRLALTMSVDISDVQQPATLDTIQALCDKGEFRLAANLCQAQRDFYDGNDDVVLPLLWAVESNQFELVCCLLALGEDVNQSNDNSSACALTLAYQLSDPSIFHLLLLCPDIDIYVDGSQPVELAEVSRVCGYLDNTTNIYPILALLQNEYFCCHEFLKLDWDCYIGKFQEPLLFLLYQEGELDLMKRLMPLATEINPHLSDFEGGRLLNRVLFDAQTNKNNRSALKVLSWYGKYMSTLTDEDFDDCLYLFDDVLNSSQEIIQSLGLESLKTRLDEDKAKITRLEEQLQRRPADSNLTSNLPGPTYRVKISLFNDLERLGRVTLHENVNDLVYEKRDCQHWFAVYLNNRPFPIAVSVPDEHVHCLMAGELDIPHHSWTEYQAFYHLLNMHIGYWLVEHLFNKAGCSVIKRVGEQYLLSLRDYHMIDGLLRASEMTVHPKLHKGVQVFAEQMEHFEKPRMSDFSTQVELYNSLAESLLASGMESDLTQIHIDYDELTQEVMLKFGSSEPQRMENLSHALYLCIDLLKNSDRAAKCMECDEYALLENLIEGKVHPECYA
ncbi:hypothetical protein H4F18_06880 [Vibrio scophthalmi]|uniref:hypothetical protein n=1 Tax=Vibrio scophthalmi TaxID=45658 RepID=UPI002FF2D661